MISKEWVLFGLLQEIPNYKTTENTMKSPSIVTWLNTFSFLLVSGLLAHLNITVDTVGLLSIMHQVFIFILKCIVYAAFCGLIWLLQGWRSRKLVDDTAWTTQIWRVRFVRKDEMSYYWWNEWKQSVYVTVLAFATIEDVNICRSSSGGEKSFIQRTPIQLHRLKALFKLLLILLFYSKP